MAGMVGEALRGRGVPEPAASLAAEAGTAVFKVAFERWLGDPAERSIAAHIRRGAGPAQIGDKPLGVR